MDKTRLGAFAVWIAAGIGTCAPAVTNRPLSAEQIQVYQSFLETYTKGSELGIVHLANQTVPLELSPDTMSSGCLNRIKFEPAAFRSTARVLDPSQTTAWPKQIRIIDPALQNVLVERNDPSRTIIREGKPVDDAVRSAFESGVLTLSEIAFDKNHKYAVLSFSFHCGMLCGHGATVVLKKTGAGWRVTKRNCGTWIS